MKTQNHKLIPSLAALLWLALTPATRPADATAAPRPSDSPETGAQPRLAEQDLWRRWQAAHDAHQPAAEARPNLDAPTRADKASGLLGMEVRNPSGESLGHIKDLVLDWKTEQVSYAVIRVTPTGDSGGKEKLLAVPLAALAPDTDQKHLVLNADRSKMQAARGFDRDNWPSASNPSWGAEPFWQPDTSKEATPGQPQTP
jgi:sporulation protein YlmC with PRC-barrel domain